MVVFLVEFGDTCINLVKPRINMLHQRLHDLRQVINGLIDYNLNIIFRRVRRHAFILAALYSWLYHTYNPVLAGAI